MHVVKIALLLFIIKVYYLGLMTTRTDAVQTFSNYGTPNFGNVCLTLTSLSHYHPYTHSPTHLCTYILENPLHEKLLMMLALS